MADSGDSSPATDDAHHEGSEAAAPPPPPKVRLMVSYGGRIQPRPHDNQLAYVSGDTKILSLERPLRFADLTARLAALVGAAGEFCVKYQLPGEDLDALVSVTNDEDLEHLVLEYDRLHLLRPAAAGGSSRGSTLRLRVFLFPVQSPPPQAGLLEPKPERHWFIEALNAVPQRKQEASPVPPAQESSPPQQKQEAVFVQQQQAPAAPQQPFVLTPMGPDYLFGLDNRFVPPPAVKVKDPAGDPPTGRENVPVEVPAKNEDRSPPNRQIQEIDILQVADNNASHQPQPPAVAPALPRNGSDDSLTRAYPPANAEYYIAAKFPEKPPVPQPATYLPVPGRYTSVGPGSGAEHAPVFFIPAPHGGYYATAAPPGANSYPTMYAVAALPNAANGNGNDPAPSHNAATAHAPPPAHQVAYDSNGRAIYYTSVLPQYPSAVSAMSAAPGAVLGTEPAKPPAAVKPTVS